MIKILFIYLKKLKSFKNLKNIVIFLFIIKEKFKLFNLVIFKKGQTLSFRCGKKQIKLYVRDIVDLAIIFEIFVTKVYPIKKTDNKKIIFDIGAHSGYFTVFANILLPNSIIYSFEPEPGNFHNLEKNLALNGLSDNSSVKIFNFGLSSKDKEVIFYKNISSANFSVFRNKNYQNSIKVQLKSLRSFLEKNKIYHIDLLKIDIEGGEYEIFSDFNFQDFKKINKLFIEIHKIENKNKDAFINFLKSHFIKLHQNRIVYYFSQ